MTLDRLAMTRRVRPRVVILAEPMTLRLVLPRLTLHPQVVLQEATLHPQVASPRLTLLLEPPLVIQSRLSFRPTRPSRRMSFSPTSSPSSRCFRHRCLVQVVQLRVAWRLQALALPRVPVALQAVHHRVLIPWPLLAALLPLVLMLLLLSQEKRASLSTPWVRWR